MLGVRVSLILGQIHILTVTAIPTLTVAPTVQYNSISY